MPSKVRPEKVSAEAQAVSDRIETQLNTDRVEKQLRSSRAFWDDCVQWQINDNTMPDSIDLIVAVADGLTHARESRYPIGD
jgi:hypothetical protein